MSAHSVLIKTVRACVRDKKKESGDIRPTPYRAAEDAAVPFANAGTSAMDTKLKIITNAADGLLECNQMCAGVYIVQTRDSWR
jgi:hypothetical protein